MKKSLLALAALASVTGAAYADVNLYGQLDGGVASVDAKSSASGNNQLGGTGFVDSQMASSLWGIKGSEDLGNGLKALFTAEGDLQLDNGASNAAGLFRRQANIGLSSGSAGTLRFGVVYNPWIVAANTILPVAGNSVLFNTEAAGNFAQFFPDNAVTYTLPKMGPVSAEVMHAFGNQANTTTAGGASSSNGSMDTIMVRVNAAPNLDVTLAGESLRGLGAGLQATNAGGSGAWNNNFNASNWLAGVSYSIGNLSLGAEYIKSDTAANTTPNTAAVQSVHTTMVGLGYQATANTKLGLNYVHNDGGNNMWNAQAHYNFSKRTEVYVTATTVAEGNTAQISPLWYGNNVGNTFVAGSHITNTVTSSINSAALSNPLQAGSTASAVGAGLIVRF